MAFKLKQKICVSCGHPRYIFSRKRCKPCAMREDAKPLKSREEAGGAELDRWFLDRRKEMTGKCAHCGDKTTKDSDKYYKSAVAHILPKALFPSVATHPLNYIELCFWNKSCHTNFDNHTLDITDLNCFDEVIEKFIAMYPSIAPKERRRIPQALMNYIHTDI